MRRIFHKPAKFYIGNIAIMLVALIVLVFFVYPIIYTIINSFKTYDDFLANPQYALPTEFYFGNYARVAENSFGRYFINSVVVAFFVVIFTILLSCTAGFALSKFRFRGRGKLEMLFLLGLMIPYQVILIPLFLTYSKLHLLNSYFSLILPQVAFGMPFAIQLFIAFFKDFENDIFEAVSTGNIAYELCRPMGLYSQWFLKASANRMARAALRCVPVLVFASILPAPYGIILPPDAGTALLFVFSLFLALGVIVAFTMVIYIITFYTISPTGVRMAAVSAADLLSGSLLPLPFFPDGFRQAVELLPFASMQNVPLRVYSGDLSGQAAAWAIGLQLFWFAALLVLGMWMMRRALHRVVVQGG